MSPAATPLPLSQLRPPRPLGVSGSRSGGLHGPAADASTLCRLPDQARGEGQDLEEEMVPVWHGPQTTSLLYRLDWPGEWCVCTCWLWVYMNESLSTVTIATTFMTWIDPSSPNEYVGVFFFLSCFFFCCRLWWEEAKGGHLLPGHRRSLLRPSTNSHFCEFSYSTPTIKVKECLWMRVCDKTLDFASAWDRFDECRLNWTLSWWRFSLECYIWCTGQRVAGSLNSLSKSWTNIKLTKVHGHIVKDIFFKI